MYHKEITESIKNNSHVFGDSKTYQLKDLGRGENNVNVLATGSNGQFVFRITLWQERDNLRVEHQHLKHIPEGLGPKPILLDTSNEIIPVDYSVQSFVKGKHIRNWQNHHVIAHAKSLLQLHQKKFSKWGRWKNMKAKLDLVKKFEYDIKNDIQFDAPNHLKLKPFYKKTLAVIQANNSLFTSLRKFTLVHADLNISNIKWDGETMRYVDWEWLTIRDPAEDLAIWFDDYFSYSPWAIKLSPDKKKVFFKEYFKHSDDRTLQKRVEIYQLFNYFHTFAYATWRLEVDKSGEGTFRKQWKESIPKMEWTLKKVLG